MMPSSASYEFPIMPGPSDGVGLAVRVVEQLEPGVGDGSEEADGRLEVLARSLALDVAVHHEPDVGR